MPYRSVAAAKKRVSALKNMSDSQVKGFISTFNSLVKEGKSEKDSFPIAIAAAKKINKSLETPVEKATANDKDCWLREAVNKLAEREDCCYHYSYPWMTDYDDDYVYVMSEGYTHRYNYSIDNMQVTIDVESEERVVRETTYTVVPYMEDDEEDMDKSLDKEPSWFTNWVNKHFGGTNREVEPVIIKQFEEEEMIAIEPLFISPMEVDGHGDTMDEVEIRKMVANFNKAVEEERLGTKLFHKESTDKFSVIKAWVNECPCVIGDTLVPEGQPIVKTKFHDKKLWEMRKSGELKGVSIGARAKSYEEIEV